MAAALTHLVLPTLASVTDVPRNDDLLDALRSLEADRSAASGKRVHDALRTGTVLIPVRGEVQAGEMATSESQVEMVLLRDDAGRQALPVFTDEDALETWMPEGATFVAVGGPTLVELLRQRPPDVLVINPAGPIGGELGPEQMGLLTGERVQATVRFSIPPELPVGLVPVVRETLATRDEIVAGYLLHLAIGEGESNLTLATVFREDQPDEDAIQRSFTELGEQLRDALGEVRLDLIPVTDDLRMVLEEQVEPVYEGF